MAEEGEEKEGEKGRKRRRKGREGGRRKGKKKRREVSHGGQGLVEKLPLLITLPTTTSIVTRASTGQVPGPGREGTLSLKFSLHCPTYEPDHQGLADASRENLFLIFK